MDYSKLTDSEIKQAYSEGSDDIKCTILLHLEETHSKNIRTSLLNIAFRTDLIEDILQSLWKDLWEHSLILKADKSISSYLLVIAKNSLYKQLKSKTIISIESLEQEEPESELVQLSKSDWNLLLEESEHHRLDLEQFLEQFYQTLSEKRIEFFKLWFDRHTSGISLLEIADEIEISYDMSKKWSSHARSWISEFYRKEFTERAAYELDPYLEHIKSALSLSHIEFYSYPQRWAKPRSSAS